MLTVSNLHNTHTHKHLHIRVLHTMSLLQALITLSKDGPHLRVHAARTLSNNKWVILKIIRNKILKKSFFFIFFMQNLMTQARLNVVFYFNPF